MKLGHMFWISTNTQQKYIYETQLFTRVGYTDMRCIVIS